MGARGPDGRLLGNNPDVVKFLSNVSREINPVATLVPDNGATQFQTAEAEYKAITAKMGDKTSDYWRGPNANAMQSRWRELHEALEKMKGRTA